MKRIKQLHADVDRITDDICKETLQGYKECIKQREFHTLQDLSEICGYALVPYMNGVFEETKIVQEIYLAAKIFNEGLSNYYFSDFEADILRRILPGIKFKPFGVVDHATAGCHEMYIIVNEKRKRELIDLLLASEWFKAL